MESAGRMIGTIVAQTALSWFVVFGTELIAFSLYPLYYEGGLQTLGLLIGPIILNVIVLTLGLPLRLLPRASRFVRRHGELGIGVAVVGIALIVIAFAGGAMGYVPDEFGEPVRVYRELGIPAAIGYFLLAFGLVHTWPPFAWKWDEDAQVARKVARGRALRDSAQL